MLAALGLAQLVGQFQHARYVGHNYQLADSIARMDVENVLSGIPERGLYLASVAGVDYLHGVAERDAAGAETGTREL